MAGGDNEEVIFQSMKIHIKCEKILISVFQLCYIRIVKGATAHRGGGGLVIGKIRIPPCHSIKMSRYISSSIPFSIFQIQSYNFNSLLSVL